MSRIKLCVASLIVAVVALSAGAAFAKPLSEGQWTKRADAICAQMYVDMNTIQDDAFGPNSPNPVPPGTPSADELAAFATELVPVFNDGVASIDALKEPNALKRGVRKLVAAAHKDAAAIEADPGILGLPTDPFARTNKIGTKLGLTCA